MPSTAGLPKGVDITTATSRAAIGPSPGDQPEAQLPRAGSVAQRARSAVWIARLLGR